MKKYIIEVKDYSSEIDKFIELIQDKYPFEEFEKKEDDTSNEEFSWWDKREEYIEDAINDDDLILEIPKYKLMTAVCYHYKTQKELIKDYKEYKE